MLTTPSQMRPYHLERGILSSGGIDNLIWEGFQLSGIKMLSVSADAFIWEAWGSYHLGIGRMVLSLGMRGGGRVRCYHLGLDVITWG